MMGNSRLLTLQREFRLLARDRPLRGPSHPLSTPGLRVLRVSRALQASSRPCRRVK